MNKLSRRQFITRSATSIAAAALAPYAHVARAAEQSPSRSANERPGIGAIGLRYQGSVITEKALDHGDLVAVCDVDRHVREQARAAFGSRARMFEDYRDLLKQRNVDVVLIGTPDHWHTKMVVDACRAGKDVYCEKPLTLTVDEGKLLTEVVQETGRIVQVGSWQRSDHRFRLAVEMVRQGRIGKLQNVEVALGKNRAGGPFPTRPVPGNLNWDLWQGQTPAVPYCEQRCHYTFRWWYEYSGGQMTDWGAHHIDIAQWAIGAEPERIEGTARYPAVENGYNVAIDYHCKYTYPGGVVMTVADTGRNGVLFTGSEGRIFVNRGTVAGKPVDDLGARPLEREDFRLYAHDNLDRPPRMGKLEAIVNHMGNFFDCACARRAPLSDAASGHRSVTTCHLGNIAMRLGRPLRWDAEGERFLDDPDANKLLSRPQRKGYEVV